MENKDIQYIIETLDWLMMNTVLHVNNKTNAETFCSIICNSRIILNDALANETQNGTTDNCNILVVSGSASTRTLHDVGDTKDVDCCKLCRYKQSCPSDVYKKCLTELKPEQYYR